MDDKAIKKEYNRLMKILHKAEVPEQKIAVLLPVVENMAWQRLKLDETREEMKSASVTCAYDNGGGQTGVRENPIFKGYVNLYRAYILGVEKFTSYLPKEFQDEIANDNVGILDQLKKMKKGK